MFLNLVMKITIYLAKKVLKTTSKYSSQIFELYKYVFEKIGYKTVLVFRY